MTAWEEGMWHWCGFWGSCYIAWADHWQTMITGLLAVGAAVVAVAVSKHDANRTRAARLRASRGTMVATLNAICDYAQAAVRALDSAWPTAAALYQDENAAAHAYRIEAEVPAMPADLLVAVQKLLEAVEDGPVADRLESIIREAQVLGARTRRLSGGENLTLRDLSSYVLEATAVYVRAESLYGYARRQMDSVDPADMWGRIHAALSICGVHREQVTALANRERNLGLPPGEADTRQD